MSTVYTVCLMPVPHTNVLGSEVSVISNSEICEEQWLGSTKHFHSNV